MFSDELNKKELFCPHVVCFVTTCLQSVVVYLFLLMIMSAAEIM